MIKTIKNIAIIGIGVPTIAVVKTGKIIINTSEIIINGIIKKKA